VKAASFEGRFFEMAHAPRLTVAEAWALYEPVTRRDNDSWQSDVGRARSVVRHLEREQVMNLNEARIDQYRTARLGETTRRKGPPSWQTLDHEVALLKRFLEYARKSGKIPSNPLAAVALLRKPNVRRVLIDEDEAERLVSGAEELLRPIILVAYDTGMRRGEVLKLRWDQVDLREGCLRLAAEDTKTDRPRNVFLTARTLEALRALPRHVRSGFVFVNPATGRPWNNIRRMWKRACKAAGLPAGVWFHDARRSFCTNARRRQVPESVVMRMSGHRTRSVFDRYNIVEDEDVRQAVRRIEAARTAEASALGRVLDTEGGAATAIEKTPPANRQ
jgi:integrase